MTYFVNLNQIHYADIVQTPPNTAYASQIHKLDTRTRKKTAAESSRYPQMVLKTGKKNTFFCRGVASTIIDIFK